MQNTSIQRIVTNEPMIDPLDFDREDDEVVVTTKRGLIRLALVAADTASRFEREGIDHDPVAWMLAPRVLFEGRSAIDACLGRHECLRAVLLHGLSIGLDAELEEIGDLMDDDDAVGACDGFEAGDAERRLWTSFHVVERDGRMIQAFDAVVAVDRVEAENMLRLRHGLPADGLPEIVEGFDPNLPLAEALVSPAVADMLEQVAADPSSPLAEGLSVYIEQKFAA